MIQNNYFNENDDLTLQFEKIVEWNDIIDTYENGFEDAKSYKTNGNERLAMAPNNHHEAVDFYRTILESAGEIAGKEVAARAQVMDHTGLKYSDGKVTFPKEMEEAMNLAKEAGIMPYSITRRSGGLGLPITAQTMMMETMSRADAAFAIAMGCVNLGETIESFASPEMIEEWVPKMAAAELWGAMALTEPNYGSDLQNVRTKAEKDANGNWRITGTKRFITHGCGFASTPAAILTLARTGGPDSGGRGLSFFIVKSTDVHIAGIEKKLGIHISPTCEVVFDNSKAVLIGEEGKGLVKYAMGMMNGARLSIAAQSMGIATASYYEAKKYASERVQFGKTIEQIPAVAKMLNWMQRELSAMRCLLLEAATSVDMYHWRKHRLSSEGMADRDVRKDEQVKKWEKLADLLTPLSKYYISEYANKIAFDAVQIHGGAGYTEEYDVARLFRDARITNIYEGTTQLQVVAAIGGVVSGMAPTGNLRAFIDETLQNFKSSDILVKNRELFESIVDAYKEITDSTEKDSLAFEVVASAARYVNGLLLERSIDRLSKKGENVDQRRKFTDEYNQESFATLTANLIGIAGHNRVKVAVSG